MSWLGAVKRGATSSWPRRLLTLAVIAGLVAGVVVWLTGGEEKTATADFATSKSLYPGDEVRILGVKVGQIDAIQPQGKGVRVSFHYDAKYSLPADVKAVMVAPALVSSRYIELTPAYTGGEVFADGASVPRDRTAVPVEFDEIKTQLQQLTTALGPQGANQTGAVGRVLDMAAGYQGQGQLFHDTLQQVSDAMTTLSGGSSDLFGTIRNLQVFTTALSSSDSQINQLINRLDSVAGTLAGNKDELASAITEMDSAAPVIQDFLAHNNGAIGQATSQLAEVTRLISSQRDAVADALHSGPTVFSNFYSIYDAKAGSLTGALDVPNLNNPGVFVCSAIGAAAQSATPGDAYKLCQNTMGPLLNLLQVDYPPVEANPLVRPGNYAAPPAGGATPAPPASGGLPNIPQLLNPAGGR